MYDAKSLLLHTKDRTQQKAILKKYLRIIEIECSSFCNRKCFFCPNSIIDRASNNVTLDTGLYLNILEELKEIDYSGYVTYSRYNEPLAQKDFFLERLRQARQFLPNARLHTNTNGDYLTQSYLDELVLAGLNSLYLQQYLDEGEVFGTRTLQSKMLNRMASLNLVGTVETESPELLRFKIQYKELEILYYARDFLKNGCNRGGTLASMPSTVRTQPCYIPFTDIYIDYDGSIMPCCNVRHDVPTHQDFIIDNVAETSVLTAFCSAKITSLRKRLAYAIETVPICNTCTFACGYAPKNITSSLFNQS